MTGKVVRLRKRGVEVQTSDPDPATTRGTQFQIYRATDSGEVIVGVGEVRRIVEGPDDSFLLRLNPSDGSLEFPGAQLGDLVRPMP